MTRRKSMLGTAAMSNIGAEASKIEDDPNGARKPLEIIQGGAVPETETVPDTGSASAPRKASKPRATKATVAEKATKARATRKARKSAPKPGIPFGASRGDLQAGAFQAGPSGRGAGRGRGGIPRHASRHGRGEGHLGRRHRDHQRGKGPPRNEFFRTHPTFAPSVPMVNIEKGMERHFFAVAPDMIEPLLEIGISVADHTLYFTVTSGGT